MKFAVTTLLLMLAAASPSMAGDLKADLMAIEKIAWTAWAKKDSQAFRDILTEDAVQAVAGAGVTTGRDKIMAGVGSHNCEAKSFDFQDAGLRQLTPDFVVLSYTATQVASCDGQKLPARVYATNVYGRQDGKWRSISYQETPLE